MSMAFDTLRDSQRLQQVGVSREQAEAHAELARDMMIAELANKSDLVVLRSEIQSDVKVLEQRVTVRLGTMLAAAVGIIVAAQKLLG